MDPDPLGARRPPHRTVPKHGVCRATWPLLSPPPAPPRGRRRPRQTRVRAGTLGLGTGQRGDRRSSSCAVADRFSCSAAIRSWVVRASTRADSAARTSASAACAASAAEPAAARRGRWPDFTRIERHERVAAAHTVTGRTWTSRTGAIIRLAITAVVPARTTPPASNDEATSGNATVHEPRAISRALTPPVGALPADPQPAAHGGGHENPTTSAFTSVSQLRSLPRARRNPRRADDCADAGATLFVSAFSTAATRAVLRRQADPGLISVADDSLTLPRLRDCRGPAARRARAFSSWRTALSTSDLDRRPCLVARGAPFARSTRPRRSSGPPPPRRSRTSTGARRRRSKMTSRSATRMPLTSNAACAATCGINAARAVPVQRGARDASSDAAARLSSGRAASASARRVVTSSVVPPPPGVAAPGSRFDHLHGGLDGVAHESVEFCASHSRVALGIGSHALSEIGDVDDQRQDIGVGRDPGVPAAFPPRARSSARGRQACLGGTPGGLPGLDEPPERFGRQDRKRRRRSRWLTPPRRPGARLAAASPPHVDAPRRTATAPPRRPCERTRSDPGD